MQVTFNPIDWYTLTSFLRRQIVIARDDVDVEVRMILPSQMLPPNLFEGFYVDGILCGFANWDRGTGHLCNIYVSPTVRGMGIAAKFIQERPLRSLNVMPKNTKAIALYQKLGFVLSGKDTPQRLHMQRTL